MKCYRIYIFKTQKDVQDLTSVSSVVQRLENPLNSPTKPSYKPLKSYLTVQEVKCNDNKLLVYWTFTFCLQSSAYVALS